MQSDVRIVDNQSGLISLFLLLAVMGGTPAVRADVIVTQLANEGVILSDGETTRVMVDGMVVESYSVYGGLPPELHREMLSASGPFSDVDLALVSHQHHDHNQPGPACQYMQSSSSTRLATSSQVLDLMREKCRQFVLSSQRLSIIDPQYGQPEVLQAGGATITAFPLSHGVEKYSSIKNIAHLIELGGMRVLHVGDAAMEVADFESAGVGGMNIDVALIPFWYFQPGPGGDILSRYLDAPHRIAVHIPPSEMAEVVEYLRTDFPDVLVLQNALQEVRFSPVHSPADPSR